jgi:MFS transporter, PPP family, 3-phenylpropionic acid transporter
MGNERKVGGEAEVDGLPHPLPLTAPKALPNYLLLYVALYLAYGTESAFLPAFLRDHGLSAQQLGVLLAIGTSVRIVAGPLIGHFADASGARKLVLCVTACLSGCFGWIYSIAFGFLPLLAVTVIHASATASLAPLSDALAVQASESGRRFQYGWVRGAGSAAFVGGTLLSGQMIDRWGITFIVFASSACFLVMSLAALRIRSPFRSVSSSLEKIDIGGISVLWNIGPFRRIVLVGVLIIGSHALSDAFSVILWREAGYSSFVVSMLWSEAVAAEVLVFFLLGPWIIGRLGLAGAATLAAAAGILRWSVMANTIAITPLVAVQALHGFTFALMHLAAMGILSRCIPDRLAATAQTIYGTGALGIASATMTLASGYLYDLFGLHAFWIMAACCATAVPFARGLSKA